MNKDITLLILAAGMGSRFGGLKQIEPMGPNDEFIIDYSVYDALKAGFTKIIFLIKEENYEVFKETIGRRVEPYIKVEYCFQKNDNIPEGYEIPKERIKPLGTAHAILCCKEKINEPFAIINADDFYGRDAYFKASEFLKQSYENKEDKYGMIGYLIKNTITEYGAVKRGICQVENNKLLKLIESNVERKDGVIVANPLSGDEPFTVDENNIVSMNFLLFTPSIFKYIEEKFPQFLEKNKDNMEKCEFLIPDLLFEAIKEDKVTVDVIETSSTWYGVTYKDDISSVKSAIKTLIKNNEYKNNLWN